MPFDGNPIEQCDSVLDLLRQARERIAMPGGWLQGAYECGDAVCALGAIYPRNEHPTRTKNDAARLLKESLPEGFSCVPKYNDTPGRTQAEIVALFERAIAQREKEGSRK